MWDFMLWGRAEIMEIKSTSSKYVKITTDDIWNQYGKLIKYSCHQTSNYGRFRISNSDWKSFMYVIIFVRLCNQLLNMDNKMNWHYELPICILCYYESCIYSSLHVLLHVFIKFKLNNSLSAFDLYNGINIVNYICKILVQLTFLLSPFLFAL